MRTGARLTPEELARTAGVSWRTVSDLEQGVIPAPREATVRRLADALKLTGAARDRFAESARQPSWHLAPPRMLPRDTASFAGREPERQHLAHAAVNSGDVADIWIISGMAGVGKTALALHVGHQVASQFSDGQLFLDLQGYTPGAGPISPGEALGSLLGALGTPPEVVPEPLEDRAALYRSHLAGTRTLIILDNAASTAQVRPLLPGTAGCLAIVTSRNSLFGLDDAYSIALDVLPEKDARTLFRAIAGPDRVSVDDPALAEVIDLCGRLPLAICVTAARLARRKALHIEDLAGQLRHEYSRLRHLQDEDRGPAAALAMSYERLGDDEQGMFRRLSLIPGPDFDAYAAANLTGTELEVTEQLLDSLLDHNLLIQPTRGRYRFHDLVRVYARSLNSAAVTDAGPHTDDASDTAALTRLLDYYAHTAQSAAQLIERRVPRTSAPAIVAAPHTGPHFDTPGQTRAWISAELANLDAATLHASANDHPLHLIAVCAALAPYLDTHGTWAQAQAMHGRALDAARGIRNIPGQASALASLGVAHRQAGKLAQAQDDFSESLTLYHQLGDRRGQAGLLIEICIVQRLTGQTSHALERLTEALNLYRATGDRHGQAAALAELGSTQRQAGEFRQAGECLNQALLLYRELSNRVGEAYCLSCLGSVRWATGAYGPAEEFLTKALGIYRESGNPRGKANCLFLLGGVHRSAKAFALAAECLTTALDIYRQLDDRRGQAGALCLLGSVQTTAGNYQQANHSLAQALSLFEELQDHGGAAETLNDYAALAIATGSPAPARTRYLQALHLSRLIASPKDEADALDGLATTYQLEGDTSQATIHLQKALALYKAIGCDADATRIQAALSDPANPDSRKQGPDALQTDTG
jgi:tetratricopeptide (TPR) repeat protein